MSGFNFTTVAQNASEVFSTKLSKQIDYIVAKIQYQNEAKIKDFDNTIKTLESKQKKKEDLQSKIDRTNKRIKTLDKKNKLSKSEKKELKNLKSRLSTYKKSLKKYNQDYKKLITTQEKYKDAYQTSSQQMLSEFQTAMNDYQQKAQALIDDTINGITDKYNQRYDELISKQDSLIDKLKSAGSLFEISGAGVITVNDIKEQTKAITDYTNKLKTIKEKVSSELFDEITTFDMTEGSAFLDQLLAMSESDLDAYNKAYTEKLEEIQKQSESIYASDFDKVASDYKNEVNHAFDGITDQLKQLGNQAMKGFVDGLTKNTDYLDSNVKLFVKSMIDTFKKQLQIASPSKVMFSIGEYTGEGFDEGLLSIIKKVQKTASMIADSVSMPLDTYNYAAVKSAVGSGTVGNTNVVNNYNLVQNNTSPKSLSALETYQARRRQIAMLKVATI
jgi:predicted  nucleic acid-binding Zn-ribbon protein